MDIKKALEIVGNEIKFGEKYGFSKDRLAYLKMVRFALHYVDDIGALEDGEINS